VTVACVAFGLESGSAGRGLQRWCARPGGSAATRGGGRGASAERGEAMRENIAVESGQRSLPDRTLTGAGHEGGGVASADNGDAVISSRPRCTPRVVVLAGDEPAQSTRAAPAGFLGPDRRHCACGGELFGRWSLIRFRGQPRAQNDSTPPGTPAPDGRTAGGKIGPMTGRSQVGIRLARHRSSTAEGEHVAGRRTDNAPAAAASRCSGAVNAQDARRRIETGAGAPNPPAGAWPRQ